MLLYPRYLATTFLKSFLILVFALLFIFISMDFVGNIKVWLSDDYTTESVLMYYYYYIPHIIYLIMPVIVFLSITLSIGTMSKNFEITPVQASGVSTLKILFPVIFLIVLISIGMFWVQESLLPEANHKRLEIAQTGRTKIKREKKKKELVYIGGKEVTISFRRYTSDNNTGKDVAISFFRKGKMVENYQAKKMEWKDKGWVLSEGLRREFLTDSISVTPFKTYSMGNSLIERPEDFVNQRFSHDEMSMEMLKSRIQVLRRLGESTKSFETQYHFKISGSFVNFFIALIALAMSHRYAKSGISKKIGIGLLVVFIYYASLRVGTQLGEQGVVSPLVGAWLANLIFGSISIVMFGRSLK